MATLGKKRKAAEALVDPKKLYSMNEASDLIKKVNTAKFDASVDLHIHLGVDPKKADQAIRGTVSLPHGTGKTKTVLVFCDSSEEAAVATAGADYYGMDEYIQKISGGWTDVDVIIATPAVMPKIARLGRTLGPRGLMPNPKSGTVTTDLVKAVEEVKKGKIAFKVDKFGIIHASIGRISFEPKQIEDNATELIQNIHKLKPTSVKGAYFKSISLASTMSPGLNIEIKSIRGL